jgi:hypothetical protein
MIGLLNTSDQTLYLCAKPTALSTGKGALECSNL